MTHIVGRFVLTEGLLQIKCPMPLLSPAHFSRRRNVKFFLGEIVYRKREYLTEQPMEVSL
jgi:hypothetical protein